MKKIYLPFLFMLSYAVFPQANLTVNQTKIARSVAEYFAMDRENIHLHLNKKIYLTNEQVWFKGYSIEKKGKPTLPTSNIYVSFFDAKGKKISSQLYYADQSVFEGRIKLGKTLPSGKYYLQAYTNFMNNFAENESSVYEITVLNISDKSYKGEPKIDEATIGISYFPESGVFLNGVSNTIGIKIADCSGNGTIVNGEVLDADGTTVSNFTTDLFGYGKFDINPTELKNYKVKIALKNRSIEKAMPLPETEGISFSVVNYAFPNKTIVKLKTNAATLAKIKDVLYDIVFQQNEKTVFVPFSFKEDTLEQSLTIANSEIPEGVVAIYLIDQSLEKKGMRIIYNHGANATKTLLNISRKTNDSIFITGSSPLLSGSLSISVLPAGTIAQTQSKSIQADFQFNNYLSDPLENPEYYLTDPSRKKYFELDNFLLTEQSKYDWENMLHSTPVKSYEFDMGLTIKGTMNNEVKDPKKLQINMKSLALGINEYARLNDKNEFTFEHVLAQDSTKIYFLAIEDRVKKPAIKVYSQLLNNVRLFRKPLAIKPSCAAGLGDDNIPFPKIDNAIMIDSVTVAAKKTKLMHENQTGNRTAKGFKISDADAAAYRDILSFLANNGFVVSNRQGTTYIKSFFNAPTVISRNTNPYAIPNPMIDGPTVSIDGMQLQNYDLLRDFSLSRVDEIYINSSGFDVANRGSRGNIQIYSKANSGPASDIFKKSEALLVTNGFQGYIPFTSPKYDNVRDEGYQKLGTIYWTPFVNTDENGTFHFAVPNLHQKSVQFTIEGMAADGKTLSETMAVDIN